MANNVIAGTGVSGATALPVAGTIDGSLDYLPIYTASATATQAINRNTLLNIASGPVGLTDSQALTNKTLGITNTVTLLDSLFTLEDNGDNTKKLQFQLSGITTGTTRTLTVPDISDTVVTLTATQTLTNKTLTSPTINSPTITNATITADIYAGYTTSNTGTIYGMSVTTGVIASAALAGAVNTAAIATNAVTGSKLATSAILLGYAQITTSATATSIAQVSGLTVTATVPAGGRSVKITAYTSALSNSTTDTSDITIWSGTVGSGTQLSQVNGTASSTVYSGAVAMAFYTPSPGSITWNIGLAGNGGTATMSAGSTSPAFILVELI